MEIWTKNDKGHWRKRKVRSLQKLKGGLQKFLTDRIKLANKFQTRWVVFSPSEFDLLTQMGSLLFDKALYPKVAKRLLSHAIHQYSNMTVEELTSNTRLKKVGRGKYATPVHLIVLAAKHLAIRIQ